MNDRLSQKARITVRDFVLLSFMAAIMEAGKTVMAPLPNIEPVSLMIIVCTRVFGFKALYAVYVFVLIEGLLWGFGLWFFSYLYVWAVLVFAVCFFRKVEGRLFWAAVSGFYGLAFGALCSLTSFVIGGWQAAVAYWISGIPFDILHAVGNFALAFALEPTCTRLLRKLNFSLQKPV